MVDAQFTHFESPCQFQYVCSDPSNFLTISPSTIHLSPSSDPDILALDSSFGKQITITVTADDNFFKHSDFTDFDIYHTVSTKGAYDEVAREPRRNLVVGYHPPDREKEEYSYSHHEFHIMDNNVDDGENNELDTSVITASMFTSDYFNTNITLTPLRVYDDDITSLSSTFDGTVIQHLDETSTHFSLTLTSEPLADVDITPDYSKENSYISFSPSTIVFTKENWNVPQQWR